MEYRNLGRSGLKVSQISLGTNAFGGRADEATSVAIIHKALDLGVNLIDTANVYTDSKSESIIGGAIRERRSEVVLATKACLPTGKGPNDSGASRAHIMQAVEASLRRLQTDYIDLYQMHVWDNSTPIEETLRALDDLVLQGKVRYIGCSNYTGWQIAKSVAVSERLGLARYVSNQPEYSPLARAIEREVVPAGLSEGVGQIVYFPLAGGLLTGKYKKGEAPPPDSRAVTQGERFVNRWLTDRNFRAAGRLMEVADEAGIPINQLAIAWVMVKPGITSAIVGATKADQFTDNVKACDVKLSADLMKRIDEITADFV